MSSPIGTYRLGQRLAFYDGNATTKGEPVLATGIVNGETTGEYVPVFASRDGGRESTTIWVHPDNVVGKIDPEGVTP